MDAESFVYKCWLRRALRWEDGSWILEPGDVPKELRSVYMSLDAGALERQLAVWPAPPDGKEPTIPSDIQVGDLVQVEYGGPTGILTAISVEKDMDAAGFTEKWVEFRVRVLIPNPTDEDSTYVDTRHVTFIERRSPALAEALNRQAEKAKFSGYQLPKARRWGY